MSPSVFVRTSSFYYFTKRPRDEKNFTTIPRTTPGAGGTPEKRKKWSAHGGGAGEKRILQQNSFAQHWARDWCALALTQVHKKENAAVRRITPPFGVESSMRSFPSVPFVLVLLQLALVTAFETPSTCGAVRDAFLSGACCTASDDSAVSAWGVDGPPEATGVLSGRGGRKRGPLVRSSNEVIHLIQGCHCALLQKLCKLPKSQTLNPQRS